MRSFRETRDEILLEICETFLQRDSESNGKGVEQLAEALNEGWSQRRIDFKISRQNFYPALMEARDRGLLMLTPKTHHALQRRICDHLNQDSDHIRVVATDSKLPDHVSMAAAQVMLSLILELARSGKERVHIGLGAGWTTRVVAHRLATLLRSTENVPAITLHAVSSGFAVDQPHTAPVAFFGFFEGVVPDLELVGMFGPSFVSGEDEYRTMSRRAGVKDAFRLRKEIDIIVTSLASATDPHGDLKRAMTEEPSARRKAFLQGLDHLNWVGDVQHLPYTTEKPITEKLAYRAMTLFTLEQLTRLARLPNKYVVLVSCPCGRCGQTRATALMPLLKKKALKVWTHLVTDIPTAREIMAPVS